MVEEQEFTGNGGDVRMYNLGTDEVVILEPRSVGDDDGVTLEVQLSNLDREDAMTLLSIAYNTLQEQGEEEAKDERAD